LLVACNSKIRKIIAHQSDEGVYYTCSMDPQVKEDKPGNVYLSHGLNANEKRQFCLEWDYAQWPTDKIGKYQCTDDFDERLRESYTGVLTLNQRK
jgi:Cu(I)/Ag(I) efflux system membrane fusion protein